MTQVATTTNGQTLTQMGEGASYQKTICQMLEDSSFFSDLEREEIEMLAQWTKAYSAPKGTYIFHEGKKDPALCLLKQGRIDILKESSPRQFKKIATIREGRTIGEMGLVDGQPHSATAVAVEDSVILLITRHNFDNLLEHHKALGIKLLAKIARIISLRLRQTTGQLADYIEA